MDEDARPEAISPPPVDTNAGAAASGNETASQQSTTAKLRKRTKTGCLTCRRRRIKCGEERPICTNCVRSKRQCEGYNQRLVFKTAFEGWPGMMGPASIIPHHTSMLPGGQRSPFAVDYAYVGQQTHYGIPIDQYGRPIDYHTQQFVSPDWPPHQYAPSHALPTDPSMPMATYSSIPPTPTTIALPHHADYVSVNAPLHSPGGPLISPFYQEQSFHQSFDNLSPQNPEFPHVSGHVHPHTHPGSLQPSLPSTVASSAYINESTTVSFPGSVDYFSPHGSQHTQNVAHSAREAVPSNATQEAPVSQKFRHKPGISRNFTGAPIAVETFVPPTTTNYIINPPMHKLETAAVEWQHTEYDSPWESDEDLELSPEVSPSQLQHDHEILDRVMEVSGTQVGKASARDYNAFVYSGVMTEYDAEKFASPLKNPHTARVFSHFIASTASAISIFERTTSPSISSPSHNNSSYTQGLWTYTMPTMALSHQGLLHAMLSLSSLHISKLQNDTPMPAFKHYGYAIKRVNRCVQHPEKRHNLTTLAATLLLGFYEVMTADHDKWCCHLSGAARLLQEIDYAGMTEQANALRKQRSAFQKQTTAGQQRSPSHDALNHNLIKMIVGNQPAPARPRSIPALPFEMRRYETYQDMFWWYARQDVYQSILAGNRLMLKYFRWLDCPPRAAVGRFDALYGTHDHLFLLLGRIADWGAKDRGRKLKAMSAAGGAWRPGNSTQIPPRPAKESTLNQAASKIDISVDFDSIAASGSRKGGPPPSAPQMPSFYGLAPMPTKVSLPMPYSDTTMPPLESPITEKFDDSLDSQTQAAVKEWQQMYAALHELRAHFGPGFEPVEVAPEASASPFGTVMRYASLEVAVCWALYYAAHIVALRAHPNMPPFAHVAAGVAAGQTKQFSNNIGRIAAGMMPGPPRAPLDPAIGATYCEVSLPLFIAGIQYVDTAQRQWVVDRTRAIEQLTGWASVGMIGQGCERAWIKTAEAGMGPPYVPRVEDVRVYDSSTMRVPRVGDGRMTTEEHWRNHPDDQDPRGMRVHLAMGLLSNEGDLDAEEQAVRHARRLSNPQMPPSSMSPSLAFRPAP